MLNCDRAGDFGARCVLGSGKFGVWLCTGAHILVADTGWTALQKNNRKMLTADRAAVPLSLAGS